MKKVYAIVLLMAFGFSMSAQEYGRKSLITTDQFEKNVRGLSIPGFSGRPQFETDEEDEFQAAYVQGNDVFMIKIEARHYPPGWSTSPYKLDGKDAEFGLMGQLAMLIIDLPETYSVLTLASTK